eukprot:10354853-Alexandrium_andersonii.AAC.1
MTLPTGAACTSSARFGAACASRPGSPPAGGTPPPLRWRGPFVAFIASVSRRPQPLPPSLPPF